jgi:nitrous oxidase accessory protein
MRKSVALLVVLVFLTGSCLTVPLSVKAEPRTITVPDDYSTVRDAVGNATGGDTILVKKGTYDEGQTLEINKTLTLIGEDVNETIVKLHPPTYNGTQILTAYYAALSNAITANADNLALSNLTIILSPDGFIVANGNRTRVTGNNITSGSVSGVLITGSHCNITDNTSGGFITSNGSANLIARNFAYQINISGISNAVANNTISNIHLSNCNNSVFYENRIGLATFYRSGFAILGRESFGIFIQNNCFQNTFYSNDVAAFISDVEINATSEGNRFYHNNFLNFYSGGASQTNGFSNFWDNGSEGNYWEGYNVTDINRDGIGDTPHVIDSSNRDNYPLMFPFNIENNAKVLPPPEPFPITLVIGSAIVVVAVVCFGLLVYLKKRGGGRTS